MGEKKKKTYSRCISLLFVTAYLSILTVQDTTPYKLQILDPVQYPNAKCLDGSPTSFYVSMGDPGKFLFVFEGGAWCAGADYDQTIEDCYQRSNTYLGTSKILPQIYDFEGIGSKNADVNAVYANYTIIFINYCDGTGHQGHRNEPIQYKDKDIWFRGNDNTLAIFDFAEQKFNLKSAETIVIAGQSAGALAVFTWIDYFVDHFKNLNSSIKVSGVADCGIFLDVQAFQSDRYIYREKFKSFMNISNSETGVINKGCQNAYPGEQWKCMMAQYLLPFVQSKVFVIESSYDIYSIKYILYINCATTTLVNCNALQRNEIENYANQTQTVVNTFLQNNRLSSTWTTSCVNHCYTVSNDLYNSNKYLIPETSGYTLEQALQRWTDINQPLTLINPLPWPSNVACSGIVNPQTIKNP